MAKAEKMNRTNKAPVVKATKLAVIQRSGGIYTAWGNGRRITSALTEAACERALIRAGWQLAPQN